MKMHAAVLFVTCVGLLGQPSLAGASDSGPAASQEDLEALAAVVAAQEALIEDLTQALEDLRHQVAHLEHANAKLITHQLQARKTEAAISRGMELARTLDPDDLLSYDSLTEDDLIALRQSPPEGILVHAAAGLDVVEDEVLAAKGPVTRFIGNVKGVTTVLFLDFGNGEVSDLLGNVLYTYPGDWGC